MTSDRGYICSSTSESSIDRIMRLALLYVVSFFMYPWSTTCRSGSRSTSSRSPDPMYTIGNGLIATLSYASPDRVFVTMFIAYTIVRTIVLLRTRISPYMTALRCLSYNVV